MPDLTSTPPRLAVTFGFSFLGFATHFGFLRELLAAGRRPVAVAGSSAGAIVAGLYATGLPAEQLEAAFTRSESPISNGYRYTEQRGCRWHTPSFR